MAVAMKTFLATFLNTAVISLVVNGNVPGWEFPIQGIGLLEVGASRARRPRR